MTQMIDGILHIADVPALVAFFAAHAPDKLDEDGGSITGFPRTPTVTSGAAALTYVRVTPEEEAAFAAMPGVTVLARAEYTGPDTPDAVYDALFADAGALALYDAVYDRAPVTITDPEMGEMTYTPPARFGAMA
jgi:hypothetical protein